MSDQKIELTDSEWMSLIRNNDESDLPTCCANVSELRSRIIDLASERASLAWSRTHLLRAYAAVRDGHDVRSFHALEKLMAQVDALAAPGESTRADLPPVHEPDPIVEFTI